MEGLLEKVVITLIKNQEDSKTSGMDLGEGQCMVCGDRSAGKHYGVMACYGCKGFFRRTIRSGQSYTCRFQQKCSIDKDQRNACRYCRFNRCLSVGMEPDAIRPDRDVIGKQKNPRRKKLKREDSSLPSPGGCETPTFSTQAEDVLIGYLLEIESQANSGPPAPTPLPIGIHRIKQDPDFEISSLFLNKFAFNEESFEMVYNVGRTASVEQFAAAMRRFVLACAHWIESLCSITHIENTAEKVSLLKTVIASFTLFSKASKTSQVSNALESEVVCLCNKSVIPRQPPRHLLDTNLLANNLISRVLDELVTPMRKLNLEEAEIVALTALIVLDADAPGLSQATSTALSAMRDRVQNALFQLIRDRCSMMHAVTSRFGNILLLLPPLAKLSSLVSENVQMSKMFGNQTLDPLLVELFIENQSEMNISTSSKQREERSTQTNTASSPALPSDLIESLHEEVPACTEPSRPAPILPSVVVNPSMAYNPFYFPTNQFSAIQPPTAYSAPATYTPQSFFDQSAAAQTFRFM